MGGVLEMRLVVTAPNYEAALAFYRDVLGTRRSGTMGPCDHRSVAAWPSRSRLPGDMRLLAAFLLVLLLLGGGMKLAGMQLPILDFPLGGPFQQPVIHVDQDPDLFP